MGLTQPYEQSQEARINPTASARHRGRVRFIVGGLGIQLPEVAREPVLRIVHEDDGLLVVNKPAGLVCHPTKTDEYSSLVGRIRMHLGADAVAHPVNRLDRETSGLILIVKTDELARDVRRRWERREVIKTYSAIVHGWPTEDSGEIDEPLGRDESSRVAIMDRVRADGSPSTTSFRVLRRLERDGRRFSLLEISPQTGRKHQIRIHLAHIGHPIVGDKLYGHDEDCYLALVEDRLTENMLRKLILPYHALHAARLELEINGEMRRFKAEPEAYFAEFVGDH